MIWALVLLPTSMGLAIWVAGDIGRTRLGVFGTAATGLTLAVAAFSGGEVGRFDWSPTMALTAALPPLAHLVAVTVPAVTLAVVPFAAAHEPARGLARLFGLLLIFVGAMGLVVIANDLVTLLIGWEIMGACSWALIGHRWRQRAPGRSANYAFVMTRAGDLGLFLALFVTFSATGGTAYDDLGRLDGVALTCAAGGILFAAASKAGQVPFAPWLFRAMDGPTSVSALLHSATMVAAGVYLLARLHPALAPAPGFGAAAIGVGLATALLGGVVALRQLHAKKVLAGSTSAQMGLMIASIGAGFPGVAILHLVVHAAMKAALFCSTGIAQGAVRSFDLREMHLGRTMPVTALLTVIAALSLAAVPPLAGGWTKEELVKALDHSGPWIEFAALAAGALSAAYAIRFVWLAFGPGERGDGAPARGEFLALGLLSTGVLVLSLLWLPAVQDAVASTLGVRFPEGSRLVLMASLSAAAMGLLAGLYMGRNPGHPPASDWLGLPGLIERVAIRPFEKLARRTARIDDVYLAAIPRGAALFARHASAGAAAADDNHIDGLTPDAAAQARVGTTRAWRGAVAIAVQVTGALARLSNSRGETLSDLIPIGTGRVVGSAGADLRRAQSGLAHQYYAVLMVGAVLGVALMIFGA